MGWQWHGAAFHWSHLQDMRKQRKAAEEKKQRAKAAKDWRDKASGRAKPLSTAKRWVTCSPALSLSRQAYTVRANPHVV